MLLICKKIKIASAAFSRVFTSPPRNYIIATSDALVPSAELRVGSDGAIYAKWQGLEVELTTVRDKKIFKSASTIANDYGRLLPMGQGGTNFMRNGLLLSNYRQNQTPRNVSPPVRVAVDEVLSGLPESVTSSNLQQVIDSTQENTDIFSTNFK